MLLSLIAALTLASDTPYSDPHADARPISWSDLLDRPRENANVRIPYGEGQHEFGELWLPDGDGPFPLVVMIHGGCWLSQIPGTILQDYLAADLRARGVAVWNLEYARIGHDTGAYPGTFLDVAAGVDHVRELAQAYPLKTDSIVFTGHSAGGHLALWAAARATLPDDHRFHSDDPMRASTVITLAGINDLEDYRDNGPGRCGEPATVDNLMGGQFNPALLSQISPAHMPLVSAELIVISGELDPIVPPEFGERFGDHVRSQSGEARTLILDGAGHFELIDPTSPAWQTIVDHLLDALSVDTPAGDNLP